MLSVIGSPFTLTVRSKPDASKVKVAGPGVEDGILHTYSGRFDVETAGAGEGKLKVEIRGHKGTEKK